MTVFQLISDTHLELTRKNFVRLPPLPTDSATVLILAGDIGTWKQVTSWMIAVKHQFSHIVFVAGNHEYYGQEMGLTQRQIRRRLAAHDNLHFLENDHLELEDCIVLGATLWTDMNREDVDTMRVCAQNMNDYHAIDLGSPENKRRLEPQDTVSLHQHSLAYFEQMIQSATKPVMIVTHHAPSFASSRNEDIGAYDQRIQYAYASDLDDWLNARKHKVVAWCHGHTHKSMSYRLSDVPVLTNAKGYLNEKTGFKADWVFTISEDGGIDYEYDNQLTRTSRPK